MISASSPGLQPVIGPVETQVLRQLARADSPTVCNIIELMGLRDRGAGFAGPAITARYPHMPPICGYAATATFRSAYPAGTAESPAGLAGFIRYLLTVPEPRIVVIQDLDRTPCGVVYGEMIARTLRKFGCAGLITNGLGRDLDQVARLNFPCWTGGVVASHAHLRIEQVGVPVCVAGLSIKSGDVLHADANGVVHIPTEAAAIVEGGIDAFLEAEVGLVAWDESGETSLEQWQAVWDAKARAIAHLKDRLVERMRLHGDRYEPPADGAAP